MGPEAPGPDARATPGAPPHPDPVALLERCRSAALEREGIAMFVAIADLRPDRPDRPDRGSAPGPDPDAARLGRLFDRYHEALAEAGFPSPGPLDDPDVTGARELIDVLVVLAEHHLRAPGGVR